MSAPWILIPNRDGLRWLPECLGTLEATLPENVVVCVVDNASTDGSREFVHSRFPSVRLLELEMNLGFVQAVNLGVLTARGVGAEAVLLHNNDTRVRGDWYSRLAESAARRPDYGILSPLQNDFHGRPSRRTQAIVDAAADPDAEVLPTEWVEGSCMWIRAEVFDRIGYLDPLFAPAYFEEVDFCRRARRAGVGVGLATATVVEHYGAGTSQQGPARRRQRVLMERNYLLYHAAEARSSAGAAWASIVARSLRHGTKAWRNGDLSLREWAVAVGGIPTRMNAVAAKALREAENRPCPILGDRSPCTPEQRYYAACAGRIEAGAVLGNV